MGKYWLKPWVYAAVANGHLILLDLKQDLYFLVDRGDADSVIARLHAYSEVADTLICTDQSPDLNVNSLNDIIIAGLLTHRSVEGKALQFLTIDPPQSPFEHLQCDFWPKFAWHHVISAILAGVMAQSSLRCRRLDHVIDGIQNTSARVVHPGNLRKALRLARIYHRLRPLLLKSRVCLYDSLALFYFCRLYGVRPNIIFGVTGEPFEAHCWVQFGGLILNDVPQHVQKFKPILKV